MGVGTRVALVAGLLLFVAAVTLRPLEPALAAADAGQLDGTPQLLVLTTVLIAVLLAMARLWRLLGDSSERADSRYESRQRSPNHWDTDPEEPDSTQTADPVAQALGGQGGARDRGFEIERNPPDATLGDHLEHLREELDEDATVELDTLEELVEETDDGSSIPRRCPQPDCDAAWTEPGILGLTNGRYQVLDDGARVQCLECEEIVRIDD